MAMTVSTDPRARATLVVGAVATVLGVALSGTASPNLGGVLLIVGWLALVVGIHRFGRLGTE
jgi:uncharacterized membrane protein YgdD (TMEM256/DUF423 family)